MPATALPPPAAPPVRRRSQQERRETTRRALLDAAAGCLMDHGCSGTTTTAVAERAGVSHGALFRHFPTKADLLTATAQHLYLVLIGRYVDRFRRLEHEADPDDRLDHAIRLLWQMFDSREFAAALDLTNASRTDPALNAGLEVVVAEHARRIRAQAAALFPDQVDQPDFAITLDLVLETMVGMAVSRIADADPDHYRRLLDHLTHLAHQRLSDTRRGPR